ncbi:hypothetical protein [Bacillus sp. AFS002410]|nr:hypothetical protein [Bacillus sp. AFS002410]
MNFVEANKLSVNFQLALMGNSVRQGKMVTGKQRHKDATTVLQLEI